MDEYLKKNILKKPWTVTGRGGLRNMNGGEREKACGMQYSTPHDPRCLAHWLPEVQVGPGRSNGRSRVFPIG